MLGSWYWTLAGLQENTAKAVKNEPEYNDSDWHLITEQAFGAKY